MFYETQARTYMCKNVYKTVHRDVDEVWVQE
jgi:hypothetical protein